MSQKKVDEYKQNKANRNLESKREVRIRRIEIGILIAVIAAGIIWFAIAGVSRSLGSKTQTVELKTDAINEYVYDLQDSAADDGTELDLGEDLELSEEDLDVSEEDEPEIILEEEDASEGETQGE